MTMFLLALALIATPARPMEVEVIRDAITSQVRAYAILRDGPNRLVVRCAHGEPEDLHVRFHSRRWLARGNLFTGERPVFFRFDNRPPQRMMWDIDHRHGTLEGSRAARFIRTMSAARRLVIRARDIENREFDLVFRLWNVGPAVAQALSACANG